MTRRIFQTFFALSLILVLFTTAAHASGKPQDKTVLTVGTERFSGSELVYLAGTDPLLAQPMVETDLQKVNRVADIVLFALAAKDEGMDKDADLEARLLTKQTVRGTGAAGTEDAPGRAFVTRWRTIQILVFKYLDKACAGWDLSEPTLRKYYDAHHADFVWGETIKIGHIFAETETEALAAYYEAKRDFFTASKQFDRPSYPGSKSSFEDWVVKGRLPLPVENAVWKGQVGQVIGPVRSDFGWHIVKIHERGPARQLSFSEAESMVENAVVRTYLDRELRNLKTKHTVSIDVDALAALGGLPKPELKKEYCY